MNDLTKTVVLIVLGAMLVMALTSPGREPEPPAGPYTNARPVLLFFWRAGCEQCQKQQAILDEAKGELAGIILAKVNVVDQPAVAKEFAPFCKGIPALVLLKPNGDVWVDRASAELWTRKDLRALTHPIGLRVPPPK